MGQATAPRRVVLYGRVSLNRSEGKSVDDQLAELRAWAAREHWRIVAELRDDGISASRFANGKARPGWQAAMDLITTGGCDTLAVWEISRASRDRAVFAALIAACTEAGVLIGTGGRLYDSSDGDDAFTLDLGGALAVRESNVTSKRTRRAVASRASAGLPHGRLPFGYQRVCDQATGVTLRWEPHPDHAPVVREVVARLLAREPADAVAGDLNRRGFRTTQGKPWRGAGLSKMARQAAYAGLRQHNGHVLDGVATTWPALISEIDHHRLVAMFAAPERDKWRCPGYAKHLGTGVFRCGRPGCDGRMRTVAQAGKPNRYNCRTCHKVSRLQAPVDALVCTLLVARLSRPDVLAVLAEPDDEPRRQAAAEVARLRAQLAEGIQMVDAGRLSLASFSELEARWLPQIAEAEKRARPSWLPDVVGDMAGPDAASRWAAASVGDRRTVLDALVEVTILPTTRRFSPFDPSAVTVAWKR
jgi:site-specific DNA recombinase